jgi:spermidine/putrescine transport system substrate-binding protein
VNARTSGDAAGSAPGPACGRGVTRRSFLSGIGGTAAATAGLGPLLSGCSGAASALLPKKQPSIPSPKTPIKWPISPDNPRIPDGLPPESNATLRVLAWSRRVSPQCLDAFAKQFNCGVQLTSFRTMSQAISAIADRHASFDVFIGAPANRTAILVSGQLIRPLTRSYLPNISQLWPRLSSPYYDVHLQYTVPYSVYTTGIAWRKDMLGADLFASQAGWSFPWQVAYRHKVAILDDYREALCLAMLATGGTNLNVTDPLLIDQAGRALLTRMNLVAAVIDNEASQGLGSGRTPIHQAWSGQAVAAAADLPPGVPAELIGYWFPPNGQGPVGNDTGTILRGARHPVLAHLFLNFLLDPANALVNIKHTGFTQPLTALPAEFLIRKGAIPASLASAVVLPTFYDAGLKEFELPDPVNQLWRQQWQLVLHAASNR